MEINFGRRHPVEGLRLDRPDVVHRGKDEFTNDWNIDFQENTSGCGLDREYSRQQVEYCQNDKRVRLAERKPDKPHAPLLLCSRQADCG